MKTRKNPCLCVVCKCGSVIAATVIRKDIPIDGEFLIELADYANKGYDLGCKDASEFRMDSCKCYDY